MKACIIGCGEHATGSHGPSLARYASERGGLELGACCDVDASRAEEYRERFGFRRRYTDPIAMMENEQPDVVVVVVPDLVTCEVACRVLERGIPVLIEKPPGRTTLEVDAMASAADKGRDRPVPHQVAFNRRFAPLVREARRRIDGFGTASPVQHVRYEMARVNRRDPDFSTTAIHGIDAVRYLAGSDFREVSFRYQELEHLGPGVANVFLDAVMASGATAHLAFTPVAGAVVERATVHARDHSLFLRIPMWSGFDAPGRLEHLERGRVVADLAGETTEPFVQAGFYGEYEAFLGDLAAGRTPSPSLRESRQSVEIAERIRARETEFCSSSTPQPGGKSRGVAS